MPKKATEKRSKRAFDLPRGNLWTADPDDDLVIADDPKHPLYDPDRLELPLDEDSIKFTLVHGVVENVVVRKEGGVAIVIDGRQRVRLARECNRRLRAQGTKQLIRVPIVTRSENDAGAVELMIGLNEHRTEDGLLAKARKARAAIERNVPKEDVARAFRIGVPALKQWLALTELHPHVQDMVANTHVLRLQDAVRGLKDVPHAEQVKVAAGLAGAKPTRATRKAAGQKQTAPAGATPASRLKKLGGDEAWVHLNEREQALVHWILGLTTLGQLAEVYPRLAAKLG